jgi:hypothetical protein
VQYGFNAFMLFEMDTINDTRDSSIGGSLQAMVEGMGYGLNIEGSVGINLTEQQQELSDKMGFKYIGDAVLDNPPSNYEQAIASYKEFPALAKKSQRVVSFTIAPLQRYCDDNINQVLVDISNANVDKISSMMEDFEATERYLRTLRNRHFTRDFSKYEQMLISLQTGFENAKHQLTDKVLKVLPKVRKSLASENELNDLVNKYKQHPYEKSKFFNLLDARQQEIDLIESIIDQELPPNVHKVVKDSGVGIGCASHKDFILSYDLGVLPSNPQQLKNRYEDANGLLDESGKWFTTVEGLSKNREIVKTFVEFAKENTARSICFIITLNQYQPSSNVNDNVELKFRKGNFVIPKFQPPGKIRTVEYLESGFNSLKFKLHHGKDIHLFPKLVVTATHCLEVPKLNGQPSVLLCGMQFFMAMSLVFQELVVLEVVDKVIHTTL